MAKRSGDFGVLLAGGILLGLGMLAASGSATTAQERRRRFESALRGALVPDGLALAALTLGRGRGNEPFWDVTVQLASGQFLTARVRLALTDDPFSDAAIANIRHTLSSEREAIAGARHA